MEATHPLWATGYKKTNHADEEIIVAFRANTMWVLLLVDTDQKNCGRLKIVIGLHVTTKSAYLSQIR